MDQATAFVQQNSGILSTVLFLVLIIAIVYAIYTYLYPATDPAYTAFLSGEADARHHVPVKGKVPTIYTGGDFTLSFWMYVDDWNYRAALPKFVFAISPDNVTTTTRSPLVAILTPYQNGLAIRANAAPGSTPSGATASATSTVSGSAAPDITIESNLQSVLAMKNSMNMFETPVDTPCDVKEVPLQRWVCITIVASGRVLDVYVDGKLTRSCVLEHLIHIPRHGNLQLRLGGPTSFGGRYSSVQMWNQQLTPDVIYGIYQRGPTQAQHNIFTDVAKYLNLNVSFTGSAPGQPISTQMPSDPLKQLYGEASSAYASADTYAHDAEARAKSFISRL